MPKGYVIFTEKVNDPETSLARQRTSSRASGTATRL
jgi:hypothetical protein